MNLIKVLTNRAIDSRGSNKAFSCKTYATEAVAEKATAKAAQNVADAFARFGAESKNDPAHYMVVYIQEWDKWVGFINISECVNRKDSTGGYLGVEDGFFKW